MQPAKIPAQSHFVQNSRLPSLVIALLIFGALNGLPLLWAQAEQLVSPMPQTVQTVARGAVPVVVKEDNPVSFEEKHSDKVALKLLDEQITTVKEDWTEEIRFHKVMKILKDGGRVLGEVPIVYNTDFEEIRDVKIFSISQDGKRQSYTKVQEFGLYEEFASYSGAKRRVYTLPGVVAGTVIDLEYTVRSKPVVPRTFSSVMGLRVGFPVKKNILKIILPKKLGIQYKAFDLSQEPKITTNGKEITYLWEQENVDADGEGEDFSPYPAPDTVRDVIEFSSMKSWQEFARWYYVESEKALKLTPEIEAAARKAVKGKKTVQDKTRALLEYLQEHFRYVSMSFGANSLVPHSTDITFINKYGDCKDLSLLAQAMLKVVGVNSQLSLYVGEDETNDPRYDLPVPSLFNHVLLKVNDPKGRDFFADPLMKGYDIGEYPRSAQGAYVLMITPVGGVFGRFPIFDEKRVYEFSKTIRTIDAEGNAVVEITQQSDLDDSISFRKNYKAKTREERKKLDQTFQEALAPGGEVTEQRFEGMGRDYGPVRVHIKMKKPAEYPVTDGIMTLDVESCGYAENFPGKTRENPVFYHSNTLEEEIDVFRIPKGFEIIHFPADIKMDTGIIQYERAYSKTEKEITVKRTIRFRRKEIPAESFPKFKADLLKLDAQTQQRIILKKKER